VPPLDRETKEYLDARIEAALGVSLKEYIDTRLTAVAHATSIATASLDKRLDSMNEFRDQLKDQAKNFITRPEHYTLCSRMNLLENVQSELRGKASQGSVDRALFISVLGLFIGASGWAALVIHFMLTPR
jgi:hypothetical protein